MLRPSATVCYRYSSKLISESHRAQREAGLTAAFKRKYDYGTKDAAGKVLVDPNWRKAKMAKEVVKRWTTDGKWATTMKGDRCEMPLCRAQH